MHDIVLCTLNSKYLHASFGLRYLLANMGSLQNQTKMLEFVVSDHTVEVLASILAEQPKIVGLGVYLWNVEPLTRLVAELKKVRPDLLVVLGGPEVSYESAEQPIVQMADHVISGEADIAFGKVCQQLLDGQAIPKFTQAEFPVPQQLSLPYELYDDDDIAHRVIYVEASRGCPFTCEFCLSSLDIPVRQFELKPFLSAMQRLLDRGVQHFKFVDRTFNLNIRVSQSILQFFLDRYRSGLFLHFEMIPDRLPDSLKMLIAQFPPGVLQFEIGVQTFDEQVGQLISRRQDNAKLEENFGFLRGETGVHIHADLIVGLPGESYESFASGFDRLYRLRPQEIQVGMLKRLKGTPITRHDREWEMKYSPYPPFEILSNRLLPFEQIHRLRRFARYWDLIGNSGNFVESLELLLPPSRSAFESFMQLCDWLFERNPRSHGIALQRLYELLFEYLVERTTQPEDSGESLCRSKDAVYGIAATIWRDYQRGGRRDRPAFLREFDFPKENRESSSNLPTRQSRHSMR